MKNKINLEELALRLLNSKKVNYKGVTITENLKYHIDNNIKISENVFRYASKEYFKLIKECKNLNNKSIIKNIIDIKLLDSDIGDFELYEDEYVPLDLPMINEAEYNGRDVDLNKPKRGGSKAYYVYVKNPDTGNVVKVEFGSGGLKAKIRDAEARKNFASRHRCKEKKDKTKPGYWSCNLPRYAESLGLGSNMNTYW